MDRKPYPSDVTNEERAFMIPYLTLMTEGAPQREHSPREVFNGFRWMIRSGAPWRMMANDLPPSKTRLLIEATPARQRQGPLKHTGLRLEVMKLEEAKRGFVWLPRRWVVERNFAWAAKVRRLARDYERLPETVAGLHSLTFAILMLKQVVIILAQSS
jgi:transposase